MFAVLYRERSGAPRCLACFPHTTSTTRYINGGVRTAENADLARGYANVVVISPFGGRTGPLPAGQFEGLRRFPGADLESQVEALRKQGKRPRPPRPRPAILADFAATVANAAATA